MQIGENCYVDMQAPGVFLNHSCDPNAAITPALWLEALKRIRKGRQITYDDSTTMRERSWTMECDCRSASCRRVVEDFDRIPLDRQRYYLERNVVQGFIAKRFGAALGTSSLFVNGASCPGIG